MILLTSAVHKYFIPYHVQKAIIHAEALLKEEDVESVVIDVDIAHINLDTIRFQFSFNLYDNENVFFYENIIRQELVNQDDLVGPADRRLY